MQAPALTPEQWNALEAAEAPIYANEHGAYAYTDVNVREESGGSIAAAMWAHAEEQVEVNLGLDQLDAHEQVEEIARRVALANAILVFGQEFVDQTEATS